MECPEIPMAPPTHSGMTAKRASTNYWKQNRFLINLRNVEVIFWLTCSEFQQEAGDTPELYFFCPYDSMAQFSTVSRFPPNSEGDLLDWSPLTVRVSQAATFLSPWNHSVVGWAPLPPAGSSAKLRQHHVLMMWESLASFAAIAALHGQFPNVPLSSRSPWFLLNVPAGPCSLGPFPSLLPSAPGIFSPCRFLKSGKPWTFVAWLARWDWRPAILLWDAGLLLPEEKREVLADSKSRYRLFWLLKMKIRPTFAEV